MKKTISMILLLCMVFALAACGGSKAPAAEAPATEAPAAEAPAAEAPAAEAPAAEAEYTLGMGVVTSFSSSDTGKAQIDNTVATVVTDAEGKIVLCRIDCPQNKMDVTDGNVTTGNEYPTKMEKGDAYGMVQFGNAIAEWDAQTKAFEEFVVGKTVDEVVGLETQEHNGHNVAVDETLYAGCTMDITAFQAAVEKAGNDPWAVTFTTADAFTLGVAAITTDADSTVPTAEEDGVVKMYTEFGAAVVGADGKILAALNDAIQPNITVNTAGEIVETAFKGTKRELGDDYNMVKFGNAIAEWDAQSAAFSAYTVGKTADEVAGLETKEHNGHQVTVDETLFASCTMQITGMQAVIAQAANYAR